MKHRYPRALLALVLGVNGLAMDCGDVTVTGVPEDHRCIVYKNPSSPVWPQGFLDVDKPAECPLAIQYSRQLPFVMDGHFTWYQLSGNPQLQINIVNHGGGLVKIIFNGTWNLNGDQYYVGVTDQYPAATAGLDQNIRADTAKVALRKSDLSDATGRADLTYKFGSENVGSITPVGDLMPHTAYELEGHVSDPEAIGPLEWHWFDNDVEMGINSQTIPRNAGEMGENHYYYFQAIDQGNGHTTTAPVIYVHTKNCDTPGCMDQ